LLFTITIILILSLTSIGKAPICDEMRAAKEEVIGFRNEICGADPNSEACTVLQNTVTVNLHEIAHCEANYPD
jgi:hypothetical protein